MLKHKLILFDVDGTLVLYRDRLPNRIFEAMAQALFGVTISLASYRFSGKTDKAIVYEVLGYGQVPDSEIELRESEIFNWIALEFERCSNADSLYLLPNVPEVLNAIDGSATKALLTGNIERCAEIKLSYFDLLHHFQFGVFGTESKDRNDLGGIALRKYSELFGAMIDPIDVVIIGDAVNDVQVAKHIGAKSIITLTGRTTRDEVEPYQPDFIFEDLSDTERVLEAIHR